MTDERSERQRAADNDGRAFRIDAVSRDLAADVHYFGRLLGGRIDTEPVPIPKDAIPRRLKSHDITVEDVLANTKPVHDLLAELVSKMQAEDRRLRRLLPTPPRGWEWRAEFQQSEMIDFERNHGSTLYRIVYTLREMPGYVDDYR